MGEGLGGLWYRAAKFDTKQECLDFVVYMKEALAMRPNSKDELVTISFGNPQGDKFVACIGFPDAETKNFVDVLYGKLPDITLSSQEMRFAREAIVELRRATGISDAQSADYARKRLAELGAPPDAARALLAEYEDNLPYKRPDPPKSKQPFIATYLDFQCQDIDIAADIRAPYLGTRPVEIIAETIKKIMRIKIKRSDKYVFDESALKMLQTVRDPDATAWIPLENNVFIWFTNTINTDRLFGDDVKGLWIHSINNASEIREVLPPSQEPLAYEAVMNRNALYENIWSFDVIQSDGNELFDFTYDIEQQCFVHPASHKCPWKLCEYPEPESFSFKGACNPCDRCLAALDYWASVLHTALRMIRREFALAPEEPKPFPKKKESWEEEASVMVGKGKNKHRIKKKVNREVEYRVVSYEVSDLSSETRRRAKEALEEEEKKGNWITWAGEGDVVWEYKPIDVSKGRTLDPANNPRWKEYKHIELKPFKKWVAMYSKEKKTVKKVTARRYKEES